MHKKVIAISLDFRKLHIVGNLGYMLRWLKETSWEGWARGYFRCRIRHNKAQRKLNAPVWLWHPVWAARDKATMWAGCWWTWKCLQKLVKWRMLYSKLCKDLKMFYYSANNTIRFLESSIQKSHGCWTSAMQRQTDREMLEERSAGNKLRISKVVHL